MNDKKNKNINKTFKKYYKKYHGNKTKKINKTIKKRIEKQKEICKTLELKEYHTFEDKIEKAFKDANLDFSTINNDLEEEIISNLKKASITYSKFKPNDDFYSYVNEIWLNEYKEKTNKEYLVQIDSYRIIQDKVYRELLEIVEKYISNPTTKNTKFGISLSNFYHSQIKFITDKQITDHAIKYLSEIDELMKKKDNLWKLLAKLNNSEIYQWASPFVWTMSVDGYHPDKYKSNISPGKLTLNDVTLYLNDGTNVYYKKKHIKKYLTYLENLFENVFGKKHGFQIKDVYDCEVKMLKALICNHVKHQDKNNYNIVTKKDAIDKFNFNWVEFAKAIGFQNVPESFVTTNLNYLYCLTEILLEEWDSLPWRTYYIYVYIKMEQLTNKKCRENFFNFIEQKIPPGGAKLQSVFSLGYAFNSFLNNEYIDKYENKEVISYVKSLTQDLKTLYKRILKRNSFLEPKTRDYAIKKLDYFKINIGSHKILINDPILDYDANDSWGNLMKISYYRNKGIIFLEGKKKVDLPIIDWSITPPKFVSNQSYIVNATYTPSDNAIDIPLGYLQKPFVDLEERGIEYNLANIGFTFCHEMSHSLDNIGKNYDEHGKLKNWWTEKDNKIYNIIIADVINQYEVFASYDGIKFDASSSVGEDLADISGILICLEYLRDFQLKNKDILLIQKLSFESFFIYFAFQQRQHINKKNIASQLTTNPHPLDKYRTNVPLSRLPLFRTIYNVKKGDKMWWHETNKFIEK